MNPSVLVVEDDPHLRESLCDTLALAGYDVVDADDGSTALDALEDRPVDLVVSDIQMSGLDGMGLLHELGARRPELPVLLMTAYGTVQQAVHAMREGAVDYLIKPFEADALLEKVERFIRRHDTDDGPIAVDPRTRELVALAERVALSDVSVCFTGESGTGKEVFARHVHRCSPRATAPFIAVNCAAIPENMLESILFGHEKGAYTGAHRASPGKFEQAQGGTLLLDEIGEMDAGLQAKLLRVLQEREVERLGASTPIALDIRVLAATNRDLPEEVAAGRFREDLYYRLNVFPIHIPPLAERPADICPLAEHLVAVAAGRIGRVPPAIGPAARDALEAHPWPGNVRELDNVMQRALVLAAGDVIELGHLCFEASGAARVPAGESAESAESAGSASSRLDAGLREREHLIILEALEAGGGSRKAAAEHLGISPRTLRYKLARMREAGLEVPR